MKRRAILSVSDKQGIVEFAEGLAKLGFELVSTGGTFKTLQEAGIPVRYVTEITGFPEILDGRVKTLHPMVHAGILARDTEAHHIQLETNGIALIDLVVVNLYPFKQTIAKPGVQFEEAIENIDIGGPAMVRAAAKNQERVAIVVNPQRYKEVLQALKLQGEVPPALRKRLAAEAFAHTAEYDTMIAGYLANELAGSDKTVAGPRTHFPEVINIMAEKVQDLRYGENPQQRAAFYSSKSAEGTLAAGQQIQGKELSYNNWMDMDAAWAIVGEFEEPACTIIKHTNPCGTALGSSLLEAYNKAYESDPVSAFGGVLAFNHVVEAALAFELRQHFFEVIVAPDFSAEAREMLREKVNLRLYTLGVGVDANKAETQWKIRSVQGGYLLQDEDKGSVPAFMWEVVSEERPTPEDLKELEFAWKVVKHVKSNAIVLSNSGQTLGIGAGQMNRVGAVQLALEHAGEAANGAYMASDAFFPFADSMEAAAKAGVRAIVQPGGSVKDREVIEAANRLKLIMLFSGRRHFQH